MSYPSERSAFIALICTLLVTVIYLAIVVLRWANYAEAEYNFYISVVPSVALIQISIIIDYLYFTNRDVKRFIRRLSLGWSTFSSNFDRRRWIISIILLSYALFYLSTQYDLKNQTAIWINTHVLTVSLFGLTFDALDTMRLEIFGFSIYFLVEILFRFRCPLILRYKIDTLYKNSELCHFLLKSTIAENSASVFLPHFVNSIETFINNAETIQHDVKIDMKEKISNIKETINKYNIDKHSVDYNKDKLLHIAGLIVDVIDRMPTESSFRLYLLFRERLDYTYDWTRLALRTGLIFATFATSLPLLSKILLAVCRKCGA